MAARPDAAARRRHAEPLTQFFEGPAAPGGEIRRIGGEQLAEALR